MFRYYIYKMSLAYDFPQSAIGLPSSLKYELPPSLPDSCRAYNVAIAPNGVTMVSGSAITGTTMVANTAVAAQPFNSQILAFDIPCGQGNVFLDPKETVLNFRLTWTVATAGVVSGAAVANSPLNLISSAASFFDSLTIYHNNVPVEIIANYNLLHNILLNSTVNYSERYGGISIAAGCDVNTYAGLDLPYSATGTYYFNFCIPLISIIGLGCDKLIPVGFIQSLQLQLQTAAILPIAGTTDGTWTTQPTFGAPVLDQFTLNMKYIDVGDQAAAILRETLQDGKWFIKASTYTNSNITVPSGSNGTTSLLFQIRNSSVKSLFIQHTQSTSAISPNGFYDGINPAITSLQASIGGNKFPNKPLSPSLRPAECFAALMSSFGASSLKGYGGVMERGSYSVCTARPANADNAAVVPSQCFRATSNSDSTLVNIVKFPNFHIEGFDLERVSGSLFSGVNTRSSPPYIDITLGAATTATTQSFCWGLSDVVLVIDTNTKHLQAYI